MKKIIFLLAMTLITCQKKSNPIMENFDGVITISNNNGLDLASNEQTGYLISKAKLDSNLTVKEIYILRCVIDSETLFNDPNNLTENNIQYPDILKINFNTLNNYFRGLKFSKSIEEKGQEEYFVTFRTQLR